MDAHVVGPLLLAPDGGLEARRPRRSADARPPGRVTFGSSLVIVAWLGSSAVFAWYLTSIASHGSIFGALATVVVAMTYLYISTIALLTGVQLDALVQERLRSSS